MAQSATIKYYSQTFSSYFLILAKFFRHEWYQTEGAVVICLLLKNVSKDDISISTSEQTVEKI